MIYHILQLILIENRPIFYFEKLCKPLIPGAGYAQLKTLPLYWRYSVLSWLDVMSFTNGVFTLVNNSRKDKRQKVFLDAPFLSTSA